MTDIVRLAVLVRPLALITVHRSRRLAVSTLVTFNATRSEFISFLALEPQALFTVECVIQLDAATHIALASTSVTVAIGN